MIIFPAIDIRDGKCVRLVQGNYGRQEDYGDPIEMAEKWVEIGAQFLHIVDLDGALNGSIKNFQIIKEMIETTDVPIQVGGGIRSIDRIERLVSLGVKRVILGTGAVTNQSFLKESIQEFGSYIAVSIDARNGFVASDGWTKTTEIRAIDFAKKLEELGVQTIVYTDIAKDGMLSGPNFEELSFINEQTSMNVIASGGVSTSEDVHRLKDMKMYGTIIGKALYTGNISLEKILKEV